MPTLDAKKTYIGRVTLTNPTEKAFTYNAELYLGGGGAFPGEKIVSSGVKTFSLAAGEQRAVDFPVTMPSIEGTFPVYLDVFVAGVIVAAYQATENVTTVIRAQVVVGPVTWI